MKTIEDWNKFYAETYTDDTPFELFYEDYDVIAKCEIIE